MDRLRHTRYSHRDPRGGAAIFIRNSSENIKLPTNASSEPVARDERAKACPTPKVGSSLLAQHKPRRPRRRGAPTTGKGREETGDGGGWRIRGAGADAHRGGEEVRGEGKGGGRSAGTRNGEVGRRMASGRVRARPFPRGDATTSGEGGDGEKRRSQARGDEARKAQGGGERNLHLVFRGRWTIARGPSHTPFGGMRSLASTYRRCGANWAPPYNSYSHKREGGKRGAMLVRQRIVVVECPVAFAR
eukprot:scaffold10995_cov112-Isochrysis_galbana.AAC.8